MSRHFKLRRFGSVLLALVLVLSMGITALAGTVTSSDTDSDGNVVTGTITISNPQENTTYYAYKIFDVTYSYNYDDDDEDAKAAANKTIPNYAYYITIDSAWFDYVSGRDSSDTSYDSTYTNSALGITLTQSASDSSVYYVTRVEVTDEDGEESYVSAAAMAKVLKNFVFTSGDSVDTSIATASKEYSESALNTDGPLTLSDSLELGYYLVIGVTTATDDDGNSVTVTEALAELTTTNPTTTINDKNEIEHNKSYEVLESISSSSEDGTTTTTDEDASTAGTKVDADADSDKYGDDTSVEIGSVLQYTIVETIPDATGFDTYEYVISDSMSQGLTLNNDVVISVYASYTGSEDETTVLTLTLEADTATTKEDGQTAIYTVKSSDGSITYGTLVYTSKTFTQDDDTTVTITNNGFTLTLDMTLLQDYVLCDLVITYSATVNSYASGETLVNDATLTYNDDEGTHTITDQETAYSCRIVIDKYVYDSTDTEDTNAKLAGAVFALYRVKGTYTDNGETVTVYLYEEEEMVSEGNPTGVKTGNYYYIDESGNTVTLKENSDGGTYTGTYTSDDTTTTVSSSITVTKEYYKYTADTSNSTVAAVTWVSESDITTNDEDGTSTIDYTGGSITTATTDMYGYASFEGLTDGVYYLLEVEAPDGYNLLSYSVEVVVDGDSQIESGEGSAAYVLSYRSQIANTTGTLLPSTGGMGTTIFYVVGVVLVAGAVVILIVRRHRDMKENI